MSGLIDTKPKGISLREARKSLKLRNKICAEKARKSLKLGSTFPSLNQEHNLSLLTLPSKRQKKNVNITLNGYGSSCRVKE
jgi:hypothetical protein